MKTVVIIILSLMIFSLWLNVFSSVEATPDNNEIMSKIPHASYQQYVADGSFPQQIQAMPFKVTSRVTASAVGDINGDGLPDAAFSSYVDENVTIYFNRNGLLDVYPDTYINSAWGVYHPTDILILNHSLVVACHNESSTGVNNYDRVIIYNSTSKIKLNASAVGTSTNPLILISLVKGDFNNDGNDDIAAAYSTYSFSLYSSEILVYYGPFTDGQSPDATIQEGNNITYLSTGDYNGDGKDDLSVISDGGKRVDVFYQNSNGGFPANPDVKISTNSAAYIVSGDIDNDGMSDIAVSNIFTGNISLYLTNGAQLPTKPTLNLTSMVGVRALGMGDFNGDGILDIIASVDDYNIMNAIDYPNYMKLYYGPFNPDEKPSAEIFGGYQIRDIQVTDFNGDGMDDVLVCASGEKHDSPSLPYVLYQRDHQLRGISDESIYGGIYPTGVGVGDFNGDGHRDIVVAVTAQNQTEIFGNRGGGIFPHNPDVSFNISGYPLFLATADFDGDGLSDFAVTHILDGNITVYQSSHHPSFVNLTTNFNSSFKIYVADFNHDGRPDIAVSSLNYPEIDIFYQKLGGFYDGETPGVTLNYLTPPQDFKPIHIDGNPYPGIAVAFKNRLVVYNQTSPGNFVKVFNITSHPGYYFAYVGAGDFNNDAQPDVMGVEISGYDISRYVVAFQHNGSFQLDANYADYLPGVATHLVIGDFNDDGYMDFLVPTTVNVGVIGYYTPSGFSYDYIATGQNPSTAVVGDLNNDGKRDFVISSHGPDVDNPPVEVDMVDIYLQKNFSPVANISGKSPIYEGNNITLSGENSTDGVSDMSTLNYTWYLWNGTGWEFLSYSVNTTYYVSNVSSPTNYTFLLVVRDKEGAIGEAVRNITVLDTSPIVNFTYSNAVEGQNTTFTGNISAYDGIYAIYWDVNGDGIWDFINVTKFNYTYISNGVYHVNLTAVDYDGSVSYVNRSITVADTSPTCDFSYSPLNPIEGTQVNFNDKSQSYDPLVNWTWNIESHELYGKDITYVFPTQGNYKVNLTVRDSDGSVAWMEKTVVVGDSQPVINFTYSGTYEGENFQFYSSVDSYDPIKSYFWEFGDGTTSHQQNPIHVYKQDGNYTVTLYVEDDDGSNVSYSKIIHVEDTKPQVNFTYTTPVVEGEKINFTSDIVSYDGVVFIQWDFGDGTTSNDENPTHIFSQNGTYEVKLTVREGDGDTAEKIEAVNVEDTSPHVELKVDGSTYVNEDENIILNASGTYAYDGISRYVWDLNYRNSFSADINTTSPILEIRYPEMGERIVSLEVIDNDGSVSMATIAIHVKNVAPISNFTVEIDGKRIEVDASSTYDTPSDRKSLNYTWDFGDGTYGYGIKLNHTYKKPGKYIITLIVTDNDGATSKKTIEVKIKETTTIWNSLIPWLIIGLALAGILAYLFFVRYRKVTIDDVYLISNSGLLIHHSTRRLKPEMDEDILSSMFTAVQQFIKDAFKEEDNIGLKRLEFGDKNIFIKRGKNLYLALVVNGNLPKAVDKKTDEVLNEIEEKYKDVIEHWGGNIREFTGVEDIMKKIWD